MSGDTRHYDYRLCPLYYAVIVVVAVACAVYMYFSMPSLLHTSPIEYIRDLCIDGAVLVVKPIGSNSTWVLACYSKPLNSWRLEHNGEVIACCYKKECTITNETLVEEFVEIMKSRSAWIVSDNLIFLYNWSIDGLEDFPSSFLPLNKTSRTNNTFGWEYESRIKQ